MKGECVKYINHPGGNGGIAIEETAGAIDHQYWGHLHDVYLSGSGNSSTECVRAIIKQLRKVADEFEKTLEQS